MQPINTVEACVAPNSQGHPDDCNTLTGGMPMLLKSAMVSTTRDGQ